MKHTSYYPIAKTRSKGDKIMKLTPFQSTIGLQSEIDRLFNDWPFRNGQNEWHPAVDVQEKEDAYIVIAELPGVKSEDVKINIEDNLLSISGAKNKSEEEKDQHYTRVERNYGSFARSFKLPSTVDADKISASYKDGILTVSLPKAEEAKPREIPISSS